MLPKLEFGSYLQIKIVIDHCAIFRIVTTLKYIYISKPFLIFLIDVRCQKQMRTIGLYRVAFCLQQGNFIFYCSSPQGSIHTYRQLLLLLLYIMPLRACPYKVYKQSQLKRLEN